MSNEASNDEAVAFKKAAQEIVKAALLTAHERKNGIGSLGEVVAHNLAWEAVLALDEANMLALGETN